MIKGPVQQEDKIILNLYLTIQFQDRSKACTLSWETNRGQSHCYFSLCGQILEFLCSFLNLDLGLIFFCVCLCFFFCVPLFRLTVMHSPFSFGRDWNLSLLDRICQRRDGYEVDDSQNPIQGFKYGRKTCCNMVLSIRWPQGINSENNFIVKLQRVFAA